MTEDKKAGIYFETKLVRLGGNVSLICPFDNFDQIEWHKDTEPFKGQETHIELQNLSTGDEGLFYHHNLNSFLLDLRGIQNKFNPICSLLGLYTCNVRNEAGGNEYVYHVIVFCPPIFENVTANQTTIKAISAKDFSIDCRVNGYPTPTVCADPYCYCINSDS